MNITLSPIASSYTTQVSVTGTVVTVDGVDYNLSVIPEGGTAESTVDSPFVGILTRDAVTVEYHYDSSKAELVQSKDLADYTFTVTDGAVPCPIKWRSV